MITVDFDTAPAVEKLDALKERLRAAVRSCIGNGAGRLLSIIQGKLSGGVLNSRSGALLNSIRAETVEDTHRIDARVFCDGLVPYARIQEYGGRLNIPAIAAVHAKALAFSYGGRLVFAKTVAAHCVVIPERSYMRSSLDEFSSAFANDIANTVADALA
jgi:hypothetical protein